jgi:cytochrome c556
MTRSIVSIGLAATAVCVLAASGHTQRKAADPAALVDQRQARMKALGAATKTLTGFTKGDAPAAEAGKAGAVVAAMGRDIHKLWPRGTAKGVSDSDAAPAIWTQRGRFNQRIVQFRRAAAAMNRAARTGDAAQVKAQLPAYGASCKACHTDFRLED